MKCCTTSRALSDRRTYRWPALLTCFLFLTTTLLPTTAAAQQDDPALTRVAANDVTWTTLGKNENDSMPIGNGDLAANVWTEQNGDLLLLLAKSDAFTGAGKLVKLGRLRIHMDAGTLADGPNFKQSLKLENASIEIQSGQNSIRIWADANHPTLHVEIHLTHPAALQAKLEDWRTGKDPDTILPAHANRISWYHFNESSAYTDVLTREHLNDPMPPGPDPLIHRCFGATLIGGGLVAKGDKELDSAAPVADYRLDLVALTQKGVDSGKAWNKSLDQLIGEANPSNLESAWSGHRQWWQQFWNRSWIDLKGGDDASEVSQGYAMQRFMIAASSRGDLPPKYNGGLFTVGHDMESGVAQTKENHDPDYKSLPPIVAGVPEVAQTKENHDPDYRAWGDAYWNQNERLLYWPLVTSGDFDLLQPWFRLYTNALPMATFRAKTYYQHAGALFPETMLFWGLPRLDDFGKDNPTNEIQSHWQKYHIQGSLEVALEMLDYYDATADMAFARDSLVPFSDAILTFYDKHYGRDTRGKILMSPAQSLETYQLDAVNPTPDNAGLRAVIPRLLALPATLTTPAQRTEWSTLLNELPPLPIGKTLKGKTPPLGAGDPAGTTILLPAEKYGKTGNSENPELYVAFPYRLFGVGKPGLQLARDTFAARRSPQKVCWGQDGTQAAVLGLASTAQDAAVSEFTNYGDERFKWFWRPAHDWIPDFDNGGSGMITLQLMLMQTDGRRIQLLPAWPKNWTADFKLHAPYETTVEGHVERGEVTHLVVTPSSRAKDVVVLRAQ
jgi:alpha-L-fucosidase 2